MRRVSGLDVHKDSVFLCIVDEDGVVFQSKYGVLTPELEQMASNSDFVQYVMDQLLPVESRLRPRDEEMRVRGHR